MPVATLHVWMRQWLLVDRSSPTLVPSGRIMQYSSSPSTVLRIVLIPSTSQPKRELYRLCPRPGALSTSVSSMSRVMGSP